MAIRLRRLALIAAVAAPVAAASAQRDEKTSDFKWSDQIAAGRWVNVHNINGRVTVGQASGNRVELTAVKRWRRGNPDDVRIEARKDGEDVIICTLWGRQQSCDDQNRRNRSRWDDWSNNNDDD